MPERITPVEEPLSPALVQHMAALVPPGMRPPRLFLAVARNEGLFAHMVEHRFIGPTGLMDRRSLPASLRELVILRTCVAARCDYEFNLHVQTISQRMGLTAAQIDGVRQPRPDAALWTPAQRAVMALVDRLVVERDVPDEVFAQAREHCDEATLIEIVHLIGLYNGVAMMVALVRPEFDCYRPGPPALARPDAVSPAT
jgi:4-carboxymuconolactone decarboxylase